MNTAVRRCALAVLLMLAAACADSGPTSPTVTDRTTPLRVSPAPIPPTPAFPPLSGPSRTFTFDRELSYRVSEYTRHSRFTLYDNGAFVLRFPSVGEGGYRGGYSVVDGTVTFAWEGWSTAGPWSATGTLKGDSLTVQYNLVMQFTDFEDAVYVLTQ